jgi:hypothetical protein
MTGICRFLALLLIFFCLAAPALAVDQAVDPAARISELEAQNQQLHLQLRQVRRQLAETRNAEQQPGWPQIVGGIGIIFGICGVAMMVKARKRLT